MKSSHHLPPYDNKGSNPPSRMAIDSLLNPSGDTENIRTRLYSTNQAQISPGLQPSPTHQQYFYPYPTHHHHQHYQQHHHHSYFRNTVPTQYNHDPSFYAYRSHSPDTPTTPSTDTYSHPRDRDSSVSSSSSTTADGRRPPRPKYEEEEMYFIWYHRVDLNQEWKEVRESFNRQFPDRPRSGFQGIQCKFYRFIKEKNCPTLREQRRMRDGEFLREGGAAVHRDSNAPKFGVVEWTGTWYPWMREEREEVSRRQS